MHNLPHPCTHPTKSTDQSLITSWSKAAKFAVNSLNPHLQKLANPILLLVVSLLRWIFEMFISVVADTCGLYVWYECCASQQKVTGF